MCSLTSDRRDHAQSLTHPARSRLSSLLASKTFVNERSDKKKAVCLLGRVVRPASPPIMPRQLDDQYQLLLVYFTRQSISKAVWANDDGLTVVVFL
jgi:hypothetical protein